MGWKCLFIEYRRIHALLLFDLPYSHIRLDSRMSNVGPTSFSLFYFHPSAPLSANNLYLQTNILYSAFSTRIYDHNDNWNELNCQRPWDPSDVPLPGLEKKIYVSKGRNVIQRETDVFNNNQVCSFSMTQGVQNPYLLGSAQPRETAFCVWDQEISSPNISVALLWTSLKFNITISVREEISTL